MTLSSPLTLIVLGVVVSGLINIQVSINANPHQLARAKWEANTVCGFPWKGRKIVGALRDLEIYIVAGS